MASQYDESLRRATEHPQNALTNREVQDSDECHHDENEDDHHDGVVHEFRPGRGNDLAELSNDLANEEGDTCEESQFILLVVLAFARLISRYGARLAHTPSSSFLVIT